MSAGMELSVEEVKARLDAGGPLVLIDVRQHEEVAICALDGAQHIPMMTLFTGIRRPDASPGDEIVVYCHTGVRSLEAASFLRMQGFRNAVSMAGGIDRWAQVVDPGMARYSHG